MSEPDRVDPVTPQEWREAVDAAHAALLIGLARTYGLIEGGPRVDVERCAQILEEGLSRGFTPTINTANQIIAAINATVKP